MKIDLKKGLDIHIGGEVARNNSLPVDYFVKICSSLQNFVNEVAKTSVTDNSIDLNNFKMEITGFFQGSAIPRFELTKKIQPVLHGDALNQMNVVSNRVDQLLAMSNRGNYADLKALYQTPISRNAIVESMYTFVNSFGTAPVEFGQYNKRSKKFITAYKVKKFKAEVKDQLIVEIIPQTAISIEEFTSAGTVKIKIADGKVTKKLDKSFLTPNLKATFKPVELIANGKIYSVSGLLAEFEEEDGYYILRSELLDIIGTGKTEKEAQLSFAEELDYIYSTYIKMPDKKLSSRLIQIKRILPIIITSVKDV